MSVTKLIPNPKYSEGIHYVFPYWELRLKIGKDIRLVSRHQTMEKAEQFRQDIKPGEYNDR